jgi:tetratricopeptide (TPR) repeat protein
VDVAPEGTVRHSVRERHRDYYLELVERAARAPVTERSRWVAILSEEESNLRSALQWSLVTSNADAALRHCAAAGPYWVERRLLREAEESIRAALAVPGADPAVATRAVRVLGDVLYESGRYPEAIPELERALAGSSDPAERGALLGDLGWCHHFLGDRDRAVALLREAIAQLTPLGPSADLVNALRGLGWRLGVDGDIEEARQLYMQAVETSTELGSEHELVNTWGIFANLLSMAGRLPESEDARRRAVAAADAAGMQRELGSELLKLARTQRQLGRVAEADATLDRAAEITGAATHVARARVALELAKVAAGHGNSTEARLRLEEALTILDELPELAHEDAWDRHAANLLLASLEYRDGRRLEAAAAVQHATTAVIELSRPMPDFDAALNLTAPAAAAEAAGDLATAATSLLAVAAAFSDPARPRPALRHWLLAGAARVQGNLDEARNRLLSTRDALQENADGRLDSLVLFELAKLDRSRSELVLARSELEECLGIVVSRDMNVAAARVHLELARIALIEERPDDVATHERELIARLDDVRSDAVRCDIAEHLAASAVARGDHASAARLLGAADAHRRLTSNNRSALDEMAVRDAVDACRRGLSRSSFEKAWREGQATSLSDALLAVRRDG